MDDKETGKRRVPKLRFPKFTDEWKQRKLGDVCISFEYGLNAAAKDFDGINKYIRITDIDDETRTFLNTNLMSPDCDLSLSQNYQLQDNDIVFARTGASVGKTFIYKASDGLVYYAGFLIRAKIKEDTYPDFVFYCTLTKQYEKFIRITSQRSGQPGVNAQEYATFEFCLPSYEEQEQIGKYFRNLDNLIILYQRKLEHLKELKKGLLQKMFPENGEKTPEFRFPGFTEAWEQRKLGELAEIVGGGTPSTSKLEYWDGDIDWYAPAEISDKIFVDESQRKISESGFNSSSAKMLPVGTVLFTSRAGIGKTAILAKEGCTNQGFQSIVPHKDKLDSYFIFSRTAELKKYAETVGAGSTFVEVSGKQMSNMELMIPPTIKEQKIVGKYFANIDHLITLHQRRLDHLKELKKGLLQQMFV